MVKNLVIVESPAKAKTIEGYLGPDYLVKSSIGHIRDLSKKGFEVTPDMHFEPIYEVSSEKKQVVSELKKLSKQAEMVWLATDEDREGEAISWHLYETLDLKKEKTKRITFNEITKTAVLKAIENPRNINQELVDAQQARRLLDRIVGFELSPVLWRKVAGKLSAGRVQSVAVRLVVEKEEEINDFKSESFFKVVAEFGSKNGVFKADLTRNLKTEQEAEAWMNGLIGGNFKVADVEEKPATKSPSAPFTTSTLQQEASVKLGFSVTRTMILAQKLYESGHITYMRTDSPNLSDTALAAAKSEIINRYGEQYSKYTKYATHSAGAQEAHEAIRPTNFAVDQINADRDEQKLYELIWKKTISSQMEKAQLKRTVYSISGPNGEVNFTAKGEVITFDGFLRAYSITNEDEDTEDSGILPAVSVGEVLTLNEAHATQRFTRATARYTEASLVKKMEELGIGRPSTYAPTISTIQKRGYVDRRESDGIQRPYTQLTLKDDVLQRNTLSETIGKDRNRLIPTDIGIIVTGFLSEHFKDIMDYAFTAQVESIFDEIALGRVKWNDMLKDFYVPFKANVDEILETSKRANGQRDLGVDPDSGRKVIVRMGKYGAMVQIGDEKEDGEKPRFASLQKNQSMGNLSFEEAMALFKFPKVLGEQNGLDIKVNIGRFGPYVQIDKLFVSIPKDESPNEMTFERALELIEAKKIEEANKMIKVFSERPDVQLLNGRYGAYLKIGKENYKLPKDSVALNLTLEECIVISENQPAASKKRKFKKK